MNKQMVTDLALSILALACAAVFLLQSPYAVS